MSEPVTPATPPQPYRRPAVLTALMVIAGLILLLPGVCALGFMVAMSSGGGSGGFLPLWLICFGIAALGVMLIVSAVRGPRSHSFDGGPGTPDDHNRKR
jgi:hypothetical protein